MDVRVHCKRRIGQDGRGCACLMCVCMCVYVCVCVYTQERLPRSACAEALKRVGKVLVSSRPERTTCLIMDLCAPTLNTSGKVTHTCMNFIHPAGCALCCSTLWALLACCRVLGYVLGGVRMCVRACLCVCGCVCVTGSDHYSGSVGDFAHLFCDAPTGLMLLCEFILNTAPSGAITDEVSLHIRYTYQS